MKYLPLGWLIKLIDVSVLSHLILHFLGFRLTIPRWLLQTSSRNTMCNRRKQQRKKIFLRNSQQTSSWETLGQTRSQAPTNQLLVLICHPPPPFFLWAQQTLTLPSCHKWISSIEIQYTQKVNSYLWVEGLQVIFLLQKILCNENALPFLKSFHFKIISNL